MKNETAVLNILTLRWRNYPLSTGLANTPVSLTRPAAANCAMVALTVVGTTFTTLSITLNGHRLQVGDYVTLSGSVDGGAVEFPQFNGSFPVTSVTNANVFVVTVKNVYQAAAGLTTTVAFRCMAQRAIVVAAPANAVAVNVGGDSNADHYAIAAGNYYVFEAPLGAKFDIADLYAVSANANQNVSVLYI